jgi:hypothetical protein
MARIKKTRSGQSSGGASARVGIEHSFARSPECSRGIVIMCHCDHVAQCSRLNLVDPKNSLRPISRPSPLIAVCDNTGGEPLAWMLRSDSAGSNTAAGHLALLDAAAAALAPGFGRKLMVTCDGAGASQALVSRLDTLAGRRGYELVYLGRVGAGRAGEDGAAAGAGAGLADCHRWPRRGPSTPCR